MEAQKDQEDIDPPLFFTCDSLDSIITEGDVLPSLFSLLVSRHRKGRLVPPQAGLPLLLPHYRPESIPILSPYSPTRLIAGEKKVDFDLQLPLDLETGLNTQKKAEDFDLQLLYT